MYRGLVRKGKQQCERSPARSAGGSELMPAVRETALESMRLHGNGSRGHKPRPVGELISQQPFHTFLIDRIRSGHVAPDMQSVKRFGRRVSFRPNALEL